MRVAYYKGQYWYDTGLTDKYGRIDLASLSDRSGGISADPKFVTYPENQAELVEAIQYFHNGRDRI